jgi:hypothetical protein
MIPGDSSGTARKSDLDHRLDTYFATLRSSSLRETLKRSVANWRIYAAVSGSAIAMATGAPASIIGSGIRNITPDPIASARVAKQLLAGSNDPPFINALRLTMASQDSGQRFLNGARAIAGNASQTQAPSIAPGGVVPIFTTVSVIQSGELVSIYGSNLANGTTSWNGDFPFPAGRRIGGNAGIRAFGRGVPRGHFL